MFDGSADGDSQETHLPDGRSIFYLITSNDLDAIRSLLTPLTLRDRQLIVYQKVCKKTLLYYACELGFKDIVKYLLDECGADIDDGYCDSSVSVSPMRIAIKKLDVFLMALLMRRGATVRDNTRTISCVYYSFKMRYYSLMSILMLYNNGINVTNPVASRSIRMGYSRFLASSGNSDFKYNTRNMDFLMAAATGNIVQMKLFLASGVNKHFQNSEEENALCLAIMNDQQNAINFLINYTFYNLKSYALALELCGAKFIVFRSEKQKGLECWRRSIRIRQENHIGFSDKNQVRTERDLGIEFLTEDEIYTLQNGSDGNLYSQALLIFLRLLSGCSRVTQNAFITVAEYQIFNEDLLQPMKILSELYYFPTNTIRSPINCARKTMVKLFHYHFFPDLEDKTEFLSRFRKLCNFLDSGIWELLLQFLVDFHRIAYGTLLDLVLASIDYMDSHNLNEEEKQTIENEIRKIAGRCSSPYPTTLMHKAIQSKSPLSVVSLLLKCSAGANSLDSFKNTPLHLISRLPKEDPYLYYMTDLLMEAGGHIDSVNCLGKRPLEALKRKGVIENPSPLSLQCLAAQVISKNSIVVSEKNFPKMLVRFIRLHSSCPFLKISILHRFYDILATNLFCFIFDRLFNM